MSKGYSYNKEKLKKRQGRAIYGLLGQQLGGLGGVVAGGTKGGTAGILGNYALGSVAGLGAGYLAGAHLPVGGNRHLDYTVERAIKHYRKTGKKNATFRDLERNYNLKLSKQAALENFYMTKEASKKEVYNSFRKALNVQGIQGNSLKELNRRNALRRIMVPPKKPIMGELLYEPGYFMKMRRTLYR